MLKAPATREEWAARTEPARRIARFKWARERVQKIADGEPRLTGEELTELAGIFLARVSQEDAA